MNHVSNPKGLVLITNNQLNSAKESVEERLMIKAESQEEMAFVSGALIVRYRYTHVRITKYVN